MFGAWAISHSSDDHMRKDKSNNQDAKHNDIDITVNFRRNLIRPEQTHLGLCWPPVKDHFTLRPTPR
jgi:hypothetical protein